jgi:lysophospholipase L1-like esterase
MNLNYKRSIMKKELQIVLCLIANSCMAVTCSKQTASNMPAPPGDSGLVNTTHLNYLYTPVNFSPGTNAAGVYIYAEAPDYHLVGDADEGFTCVDDVARAAQVYLRSNKFSSDTSVQTKAFSLIRFILEMQSDNGYFYNFLFPDNTINKTGVTSINNPNWWSWRALYTLTEAGPIVKTKNIQLSDKIDMAVNKLIVKIKTDLVNIPQTTKVVSGITVPQWLPAGSGTDQAAILILGLIPYCMATNDAELTSYVRKLADGIALMQQGDATNFPYSCFLSWENTWHAYGSDQAYSLLKAGVFLNDAKYTNKALAEVDNFYSWLLKNGMKSSFVVAKTARQIQLVSEKSFEQIAYGLRPMVFAAAEAYRQTGQPQYADIAGHLAAWFFGANDASTNMYSLTTGRGYDGITSPGNVNRNSGAESTIEALLALQRVESYPAVKAALNKYKKQ